MRLVKVKQIFFDNAKNNGTDSELMENKAGRPCVLILKLRYKNQLRKFCVPLRSNIASNAPREHFFALPPNSDTRSGNHHGIHYIKIFPIDNYLISNNNYLTSIKRIIDANEAEIIQACQNYLTEVENGNKHLMTPDIDGILTWL